MSVPTIKHCWAGKNLRLSIADQELGISHHSYVQENGSVQDAVGEVVELTRKASWVLNNIITDRWEDINFGFGYLIGNDELDGPTNLEVSSRLTIYVEPIDQMGEFIERDDEGEA